MTQYRHWCLTINNPVDGDVPEDKTIFSYLVIGKEVGKEGVPHLQIFVSYPKRKRLAQVKSDFPRAHIEQAKGTPLQASTYCKKDDDWVEWG